MSLAKMGYKVLGHTVFRITMECVDLFWSSLNHLLYFNKPCYYGVHSMTLLLWVGNWLTGQTLRVVVEGQWYAETWNTSGVPQGTVSGLTLFIMYDISSATSTSISLFADDYVLYSVIDSTRDAEMLYGTWRHLADGWTVWWASMP